MPAESRTIVTAHDGSILSKNGYGLYINPFRNFGPYRIRFQFDDLNHDPTSVYPDGTTEWIRVSYSPNIWDYYYPHSSWLYRFGMGGNASPAIRNAPCSILMANLEGVTEISGLFHNYLSNPNYTTYIHDVYNFYAPDVADVDRVFYDCRDLETCDIISFGAPMTGLETFCGCTSLKKAPYFNTSNMTKCSDMFNNCISLVDVPLYDMSSMTDTRNCFTDCSSLEHVPNFDTSSVRHMRSMFLRCTSLKDVPNFDISSTNSLAFMFCNCKSLTVAPDLDTHNITNFSSMFTGCSALTRVPLYDTSRMTTTHDGDHTCDYMFHDCVNVAGGALDLYNQIASTGWHVGYYSDYRDAFKNCGILTEQGYRDLEQIPTAWGGLKEN